MADKLVTALYGTDVTVATSGTIAVNTATIAFDEATELNTVIEQVERAKLALIDYYSDKS